VGIAVCKPFSGGLPKLRFPALCVCRGERPPRPCGAPLHRGEFLLRGTLVHSPLWRGGAERRGGFSVPGPFPEGAPAAAGGVARKSAALFTSNQEERAPRVFCLKTRIRGCLPSIRVRIWVFPSREGGLCRPASISAWANRRVWRDGCSEELWGVLYSVGASWFSGAYSPFTGLSSTAGVLSRLLNRQARRFGFRPYIRAGLRHGDFLPEF
jgi:hypothetical protein